MRARIRKVTRRILLVLLTVAVLCVGAYVWMNAVANARLEAELTRLRDAGEPLRLTEMVLPPIPAERNAAIPLRKAFALIVDEIDLLEEFPDFYEVLEAFDEKLIDADEAVLAKIRTWVERNSDALDFVEEALDRPECRLGLDYSDPINMDTPLPKFLEVARLLQARAILSARDGRLPDAFEAVRTALRTGAFIAGEPTVIMHLVEMSTAEVALRTLDELLDRGEPSEEACRGLLAAIERIDTRAVAHRAMRGERCLGLFVFECVLEGVDQGLDRLVGGLSLLPDPVIKLDETYYLRLMALGIEVAGRPWHETAVERAALDAAIADRPWYGFLSSITFPVLTIALERTEQHVARLRLARLVLALEIHERRHDALPESLEPLREILGDLPIDPLSGKPFTYRRDGDGYDLATPGREVVWGEYET